jgi:hypothetical protein
MSAKCQRVFRNAPSLIGREEFFFGDRRSKRSARRNASLTSGEIGYELLVRKNGQR